MKIPLLNPPSVAAIGVVGACAACCAAPVLLASFASGASLLGAGVLGWFGMGSFGTAKTEFMVVTVVVLLAVGGVIALRIHLARRAKACACESMGTGASCTVNVKDTP